MAKLKYRAIYGYQFILYIFPTKLNWTIKKIPPSLLLQHLLEQGWCSSYKHIRYAVESKCRKNKIKINDPMCNLSKTQKLHSPARRNHVFSIYNQSKQKDDLYKHIKTNKSVPHYVWVCEVGLSCRPIDEILLVKWNDPHRRYLVINNGKTCFD